MATPTLLPLEDGALRLRVQNSGPISAKVLADLLTALAADYRRTNRGRTLTVVELRTGSLWTTLADAAQVATAATPGLKDLADLAKGTKAIAEFGQSLVGLIKKSKEQSKGDHDFEARNPLERSLEGIIRMSIDAEAEVTVTVKTAENLVTDIHIVPREAQRIKAQSEARQLLLRQTNEVAHALTGNSTRGQRHLTDQQSDKIADSFVSISGAGSHLGVEACEAILALVSALKSSGLILDFSRVAAALEIRGRRDIAVLLRGAGDGNTEVKLLS